MSHSLPFSVIGARASKQGFHLVRSPYNLAASILHFTGYFGIHIIGHLGLVLIVTHSNSIQSFSCKEWGEVLLDMAFPWHLTCCYRKGRT